MTQQYQSTKDEWGKICNDLYVIGTSHANQSKIDDQESFSLADPLNPPQDQDDISQTQIICNDPDPIFDYKV